jgi:hypothetical protein
LTGQITRAIFRIPPFRAPRIAAIKKSMKHYHFDWNVALELLSTLA